MKNLKKQIQTVIDAYNSQNFAKAESLCKKFIIANPKVAFLYNLCGLILAEQEKIDESIKFYEEGLKIDPGFAIIYNNLGLLFIRQKFKNYIKKAENLYKKSISLDKKIPEPHNNLGNLYTLINKNEKAIDCYKKAININPKSSYAYHNLGTAYVATGELDSAKVNFKEAIKLNPEFVDPHRSLSGITKYTNNNEHFNELKKIYKETNIGDSKKRIELGFALGKAYEDIKNFDKSFVHYKEANFLHRKKIDFSLKIEKEKFELIKNIYDKKLFDKYKKKSGYSKSSPIFIIGMPRSGTTLVEQILSSHPKVYGGGELELIPDLIKENFGNRNLRPFFDEIANLDQNKLKNIGAEYVAKIKDLSNNAHIVTDKLPKNFLYVGFIKLILPKSKIVHCYRNPKDTCLSIFKNHFASGDIKFGYDMNEVVEYYNLYNDLMKYWANLLPSFIFNIKYENLISNTKTEIQGMLKNCGLVWSDDCLNFHNNRRSINTASAIQARNKIYTSSVNSWKNYEKYLKKYLHKLRS